VRKVGSDSPKARKSANTASPKAKKAKAGTSPPGFVAPQLCVVVERPPSGAGWVHEIKFDGYRVQLRVEGGKATLKTRKGQDWTEKFEAIAKEAKALPDVLIDGEIVALDSHGAPDFSGLQAALSDGKTDDLIFFAFDLLFADGEDLRRTPLGERKARLKELLEGRGRKQGVIRYVEHFETGGDAILQSACKLSLEGIVSKKLSAPYRSGRSEDWTKAKCRAGHEVVIGEEQRRKSPFADGWRPSRRSSGLCRRGRHRFRAGHGQARYAGAESRGLQAKSVRRQECAAQNL
jgi:bifunctional non-homologous end joining protein LigD